MVKHYTDAELIAELGELTVITDSREQVNDHIIKYLDDNGIKHRERKLNIGDYSCQLGNMSFEYDFAIERKRNIDEIAGNFTADRERFEREFMRAKALGTKVYLLIENASWQDIYSHNYRSKLEPKSLLASLLSWQTRFNITVVFCQSENTPKLIHGILYYATREALLYG